MPLSAFFSAPPSPLQPLHLPWLESFKQLHVKRDDLLHPIVSGNKWRKLRYAFDSTTTAVASMGGPYSNHLHALAYLASQMKWPARALVRGDAVMTPTLQDCVDWGMQLQFVSRSDFRQLRGNAEAWRSFLPDNETVWLPEGGASALALRGLADLVDELPFTPDVVICAGGTGTMAAGLAAALPSTCRVIAITVIKNGEYLRNEVAALLSAAGITKAAPIEWVCDLYGRGYGQADKALLDFIGTMEKEFSLPLEPVYTGKVLYALPALAQRGLILPHQRIVVVHSGGRQGARGFT